jgi:hypothetical protein
MNEMRLPLAVATGEARRREGLTYRAFASALCEHLEDTGISHQSVMNWEKGITEPGTDFLLTCLVVHDDWRAEWAVDCLCRKLPAVFDRRIDGRLVMLSRRVAAMDSVPQAG